MSISNESRFTVPFSHINKVFDMFAEEGNVAECEYLLKAKANPDLNHHLISSCFNEDEETENRNELISLFVKNGANVSFEDEHGRLAMFGCVLNSNMEGVKLLMEHNCSINIQNKDKQSSLHFLFVKYQIDVGDFGIDVRPMMELGYDVNVQDPEGFTVLHHLMYWIYYEKGYGNLYYMLDDFLQDKEIKLNVKNNEGETPLHLARHEYSIIRLLEAKADPNIRNNKGYTAVEKILENKGGRTPEVIKLLLENKCSVIDKNNPLVSYFYEIKFVDVECIKLMIEHKLDLNQSLGKTTVHEKIISKYCDKRDFFGFEATTSFVEYLNYSKSLGVNINNKSKGEMLALIERTIEKKDSKSLDVMLGCVSFKPSFSELLLSFGSLKFRNSLQSNELCEYSSEQLPLIKLLVKRGVTCSHIDHILLHYISSHYRIDERDDVFVRSLIEAKADPNYTIHTIKNDQYKPIKFWNYNSQESIIVHQEQSYLEFAHENNRVSLIFTLLACGAEIPSQLSNIIDPNSGKEADVLIQNALNGGKFWSIKNHHLFCEKHVSMIRTFLLCLRTVGVSRRILPLPLLYRILESAVVYRTFPNVEGRSSLDGHTEQLKGISSNESSQKKRKRSENDDDSF